MDPTLKEILKSNRTLLLRNIIPCQELYGRLTEQNVFPESMLQEIKDQPTTEEKNGKLLEFLEIRGGNVYTRFCDALQLSGHNFLADFIREEASVSPQSNGSSESSEVLRKFPKLEKLIQAQDQEELASYLNDKIKEQAIRQTWRSHTKDKEKALDAKQKQIEESWKFKEILIEKDKAIQDIQDSLHTALNDCKDKAQTIRQLTSSIDALKDKHKEAMETQMQFNLANDSSIRRMYERQDELSKRITEMNTKIEECLAQDEPDTKQARESHDSGRVKLTVYDTIYENTEKLIRLVGDVRELKGQLNRLDEERHFILIHIGAHDQSVQFMDAFKEYIVTNEERVTALKNEINSLQMELSDKENSEIKVDVVNALQHTIEDLKISLKSTEQSNAVLERENMRLKALMSAYEAESEKPKSAIKRKSPEKAKPLLKRESQTTVFDSSQSSAGHSESGTSSPVHLRKDLHPQEKPKSIPGMPDPAFTNGPFMQVKSFKAPQSSGLPPLTAKTDIQSSQKYASFPGPYQNGHVSQPIVLAENRGSVTPRMPSPNFRRSPMLKSNFAYAHQKQRQLKLTYTKPPDITAMNQHGAHSFHMKRSGTFYR